MKKLKLTFVPFALVVVFVSLLSFSGLTAHAASCGVIQNANGTYTFQRLQVTNSIVTNNAGCPVPLLGTNGVGAEAGDGGNIGGNGNGNVLPIHDIVRVAFNERWYVEDVNVPKQGMGYQAWIDTIVQTYESRGDYVLLDADTAFFEPPCGGSITFCPAQGQGDLDYNNPNSPYYHNPDQLEESQDIAIQALTALAQRYGSDPAVLFDVWNEPGGYIFIIPNTEQYRAQWMDQRINTVQQYGSSPTYNASPVVVYNAGDTENLSHTQPNLIFDFHVYPEWSGISPVTHQYCSTSGPQSALDWSNLDGHMSTVYNAGRAIIVGEWGGCYLIPGSAYNDPLLSAVEMFHGNMAYYDYSDLVTNGQINANGQLEQQDYATLEGQ